MTRFVIIGLAVILNVRFESTALAQPCEINELVKLVASDRGEHNKLAFDVAMDGDWAMLGAFSDDGARGSVYVFHYDGGVTGSWIEAQKIVLPGSGKQDWFGYSLAMSGSVAVIGARGAGGTGAKGEAHVYQLQGGVWIYDDCLMAPSGNAGDHFAHDVAVSGGVVVASSPFQDANGIDAGALYVFEKQGLDWVHSGTLLASTGAAGDHFGVQVAVDGDVIVAGSHLNDNSTGVDAGAAYLFEKQGANWVEKQVFTPPNSEDAVGDEFGWSVAVDGDVTVISSLKDDDACPLDPNCNSGSAYVYRKIGNEWPLEAKLTAIDASAIDAFGSAVDVCGDTIAVGARNQGNSGSGIYDGYGTIYVYRFDGVDWIDEVHLTATDRKQCDSVLGLCDQMGWAIALSGDTLLAGAPNDDDDLIGRNLGAAYLVRGLSDCDGNGFIDACEVAVDPGLDANGNGILDICDFALTVAPEPLVGGQVATLTVVNGKPDAPIALFYSKSGFGTDPIPLLNVVLDIQNSVPVPIPKVTDSNGEAVWSLFVPLGFSSSIWIQSVQFERKTNVVETTVE